MTMNTITLIVSGMSCMGCVNSVKNLLGAVDGVQNVEIDVASGRVEIQYDATRGNVDAMRQAIEDGGYKVVA
ncbi:copper chaperone [Sulfuritortus calidifontis]|uniref:Copper chaperone n=2 Tax=Sulfuritortus calidifontis TaxID=1914471 RepID=A0A4R3JWK3_9PROT|nr:copper chaperone [Sulfuritortus calidifontis]